jgi:hypothetical protein
MQKSSFTFLAACLMHPGDTLGKKKYFGMKND